MGKFDTFRNYMSSQGASIKDEHIKSTIDFINDVFADNPSYIEAYINGVKMGVILTVGKETNYKTMSNSNYKTMLLSPNTVVPVGSVVTVDSDVYLVVDFLNNVINPKCELEKCNQILKWQNEYYEIKSTPAIIVNRFAYLEETKHTIMPDSIFVATLPLNDDTKFIHVNQRLLFNDSAFKVVFVDKTVNGLIKIQLEEDILSANDLNGVADYIYGTYSIEVNNGNNISVELGNSVQLDTVVKYGDKTLPFTDFIFYSHNDDVATISSDGLISTYDIGQAVIDITAFNITTSITVTVIDSVIEDVYTLSINGEATIYKGSKNIYSCSLYNNGKPVPIQAVTWSIDNGFASIERQSDTECELVAGDVVGKYVSLTCILDSDDSVTDTVIIYIKGLW